MTEIVQRVLSGRLALESRSDRRSAQFGFGMDEAENPGRMCVSFLAFDRACHVVREMQSSGA